MNEVAEEDGESPFDRFVGRWLVELMVAATIVFLIGAGLVSWRDADLANDFPSALIALPPIRPQGGYQLFTASELNQTDTQPVAHERITYVPASTPANRQDVISVNPIDADTWSAVERGPDGRCYAVLTTSYGPQNEYGDTYFAVFPRAQPCLGSRATRRTVKLAAAPDGSTSAT